jgi:SAM-dependent methyltransferase
MTMEQVFDGVGLRVGRQLAHPSGLVGRLLGRAMHTLNRVPLQRLLEALDIQSGDRVLDIGCGDGSAIALMPQSCTVIGLDQSATMISAARRRLRREVASGRVSLVRGDMTQMPFDAHQFDRIAAANVLYFCKDVPAFLAECRRILRPGGRLAIYVTSGESMRRWRFARPATHRLFSKLDLVREFEQVGITREDRRIERVPLPGGLYGLVATASLRSAPGGLACSG